MLKVVYSCLRIINPISPISRFGFISIHWFDNQTRIRFCTHDRMGEFIFQTECSQIVNSWKIIHVVRQQTSQPKSTYQSTFAFLQDQCLKEDIRSYFLYLKLEQGWMIQWPMAFCRTLSFIRAFLDPNNFMASLLSVGAKIFCSWFLTHPGLDSLETEFLWRKWGTNIALEMWKSHLEVLTVPTSSLGVPYRETSSFSVWKWTLLFGTFTANQ